MTVVFESHPVLAATRVVSLRTQHGPGLLGVPGRAVRLSWQVESSEAAATQVAYQLATGDDPATLVERAIVRSSDAVGVPAGDVAPGARSFFAVRVATAAGWSPWSVAIAVEAGIESAALAASVIGIPSEVEGPVALLRKQFRLDHAPQRARLRLSALGLVDAWINGVAATDALFTPGWTSYDGRVLVDTLDVTSLLRVGENVIVLAVGDGWYRGRMGFSWRTEIYGDRSGALAQIDTENGVVLATDASWRGGFGAVQKASIYEGTTIDFARAPQGLHAADFDDSEWQQAEVIESETTRFEPRSAPPVRVVEELPMVALDRAGAVRLNAGQNITGWVRLLVRGTAGATVTVRHAEVLEPSGALHTAALRSAIAIDTYILDRDGEHELEPQFTFHGFQYAEVTGAEVLSATAIAISSDLAKRSTFSSSLEALNGFHSNVFWSQRDNFVSVPTDCPQRDERLGWTGDAQAFAATANTLMESESFWLSWLRDLELDQTDEGGVASIVPNILRFGDMLMGGDVVDSMGRAGWADAATIVPWAVYEAYGSTEVLEQQLDSMRRWIAHLRRRAGDDVLLPTEPFQYGDWLDPDAPAARPWQAKVSSDYVANAFYVHSTRILARVERLVGSVESAIEYDDLADNVAKEAWARWGEQAIITQTGAALALEFDLAPRSERERVAATLAANVRAEAGRIATGFLGTPLVLFALSNNGYLSEAYLMLTRRAAPSWLYQVDRGATTVWERWDAILPDGNIHSGTMEAGATAEENSMLSFNHYAYGAVIDWVYRTVAGLAPVEAGYRVTRVAPRPARSIPHAAASIATPFGQLSISWRLQHNVFLASLEVPFGVRVELDLPLTAESVALVNGAPAPKQLGSGAYELRVSAAHITE